MLSLFRYLRFELTYCDYFFRVWCLNRYIVIFQVFVCLFFIFSPLMDKAWMSDVAMVTMNLLLAGIFHCSYISRSVEEGLWITGVSRTLNDKFQVLQWYGFQCLHTFECHITQSKLLETVSVFSKFAPPVEYFILCRRCAPVKWWTFNSV